MQSTSVATTVSNDASSNGSASALARTTRGAALAGARLEPLGHRLGRLEQHQLGDLGPVVVEVDARPGAELEDAAARVAQERLAPRAQVRPPPRRP